MNNPLRNKILVWDWLDNTIGWTSLALAFFLLALLSHIEIRDLDLWFHIGAGRAILATGEIPRVDVFSHTMAGRPWVDHEWLFQILATALYDRWGADGLIWMQEVLVFLMMGLLTAAFFPMRRMIVGVFALIAVTMVFPVRLTHRPDLFSLLFMSVFIVGLWTGAIRRRRTVIWLCVIQVLWTNVHGFFALGVGLVWLTVLAESLKRRFPLVWRWNRIDRYDDRAFHHACLLSVLLPLCCLINPYGIEGAAYPFHVLSQAVSGQHKAFFANIVELQKPLGSDVFDLDRYGFYKIMVLLSAALFYYNRRRIDLKHFLVWALMLFLSFSASRNLMYFMIIAFVVVCRYVRPLYVVHIAPVRFTEPTFRSLIRIGLKIYLCVWLVLQIQSRSIDGYFDFETGRRKDTWSGVSTRAYPSKAVRFLKQHGLEGRIFNDFNSGAHLIGHVYPKIRVFIDGRAEFYGQDFFNRMMDVHRNDDVGLLERLMDRYPIDLAFIDTHFGAWPPKHVIDYFQHWPGWRLVYLDDDGLIFVKQDRKDEEWIQTHRVDTNIRQWRPKRLPVTEVASTLVPSHPWIKRAAILYQMEAYDAALAELEEGLMLEPHNEALYRIKGMILQDLKQYEAALKEYRKAVVLDRRNYVSFMGVIDCLRRLGEREAAEKELLKIHRKWPEAPEVDYVLARVALDKGDETAVAHHLREAVHKESTRYEKSAIRGWIDLARAWSVKGDTKRMEAMMAEAYRRRPLDPFVNLVHGEIYERMGDVIRARRIWRAGLKKSRRFRPLYERLWLTNAWNVGSRDTVP